MKLEQAREVAENLVEQMRPHCDRIEIAGSIRRENAEVKDIEIVAIPKWKTQQIPQGLFGEMMTARHNLLERWATSWIDGPDCVKACPVRWIKPGTSALVDWPPKADGRYWRGLLPSGINLDLFLTERARWGTTLLIRTGSKEFSKAVAEHALQVRWAFKEGALTRGGVPMETFEEADVFEKLGLRYVEPRMRRAAFDVRRVQRSQ